MQVSRKKLSRFRPRVLTLFVFFLAAAVIALANLSFDEPSFRSTFNSYFHPRSYGWPIIWHRLVLCHSGYSTHSSFGWYYSAPRLAANIILWLILLTASSGACEWLVRRYRPRPRWSMRTLLIFVALMAGLCAWYAKARNRAALEDEVVASFPVGVSVERWGPKWLDLFGMDRLRRRIVSVDLSNITQTIDEQELLQLARLPDLRSIELLGDELTPASATALGGMRQLQTLCIWLDRLTPSLPAALNGLRELRSLSIKLGDGTASAPAGDEEARLADKCLAAISQMTRLETLSLWGVPLRGESLARLANIKGLKSLQLDFWNGDWNGPEHRRPGPEGCLRAIGTLTRLEWLSLRDLLGNGQLLEVPNESLADLAGLTELHTLSLGLAAEHRPMLSHLPPLPRLEALDLRGLPVDDGDLRRLSLLPRLKSLSLGHSVFSWVEVHLLHTRAGLAELASAPLLEELWLDGASPEHVLGLLAVKRLKRLHLVGWRSLITDDGGVIDAYNYKDYPRAVAALRESNPGIIIDAEEMPDVPRLPDCDAPGAGADRYGADPERPSSWVPGGDLEWMTPQEVANFEKDGWRASFYGLTWPAGVIEEFDAPRRGR